MSGHDDLASAEGGQAGGDEHGGDAGEAASGVSVNYFAGSCGTWPNEERLLSQWGNWEDLAEVVDEEPIEWHGPGELCGAGCEPDEVITRTRVWHHRREQPAVCEEAPGRRTPPDVDRRSAKKNFAA